MTDATRKNKIIFVPGKNPKPDPAMHRALLWHCLLRGAELVDPECALALAARPEAFALVAWNALYYGELKDIEDDLPWIEALCRKTGPDPRDVREATSWRLKRARLLYLLADHLPFLIGLLPDPAVKGSIHETDRYFRNEDDVGTQVRELLKAPLRRMLAEGDRVLVIGHSMGSIIAYDALWELTHDEGNPGKVDLLTLGSPLGMHFVFDRLLGARDANGHNGRRYPGNIRRWVNIAAHGDLVAFEPAVHGHFHAMVAQRLVESIEDRYRGVFNYFRNDRGLNAHRSYGYLVQQEVARTIVGWWRGAGVTPLRAVPVSRPLADGAGMA